MTGGGDKIDALARALDAVDVHVRIVDGVAKRSEKNRLGMLHLHALAAVLIGPLFAVIGREGMAGPTWAVARMIPGAPVTLGLFMLAAGAILGPATWHRSLPWEKVALWMLLLWYGTIAASFAGAVLLYLVDPRSTGGRPSYYAPVVYLHLCVIMIVHLVTLSRMTRRRVPA